MSDTKILSTEEFDEQLDSYYHSGQGGGILERHNAAQAKHIEDLREQLQEETGIYLAIFAAIGKSVDAPKNEPEPYASVVERTVKLRMQERDAAIQRAEECKAIAKTWQDEYFSINDILRQIQAALPPEEALEIADQMLVITERDKAKKEALRAYAATLRKEG